MKIKEIYKKLQKYATLATSLDDERIIFANQSQKIPSKPFITIALRSFKQVGTAISKTLMKCGTEENILSMRASATFQCFADNLFEAEELMSKIALNFNTSLTQIFEGKIAKLKTLKEVTGIPNFDNNQLEHRAIYEVEIGFNQTISSFTGFIEQIQLDGQVDQQQIINDRIIEENLIWH